jgi:type IV pilus assembly protein PilA
VVLLILTVLASIAIPLFTNQRGKAHDSEAKAAVRVATGAVEVYHQDHNTYDGADADALVDIEPSLREARGLDVDGDASGFTITVESASGGSFTLQRSGATTVRSCGAPGNDGCPASGHW